MAEVAETKRKSVAVRTTLSDQIVVAAPGPGLQIVVFGVCGSKSASSQWALYDAAGGGAADLVFTTNTLNPFSYVADTPLFACRENRELRHGNFGLQTSDVVVSYEIWPVGE